MSSVPGGGERRLGLEFFSLFVEIDLLFAELERHAAFAEALELHPEHPGVEIDALFGARRGEDDMVEMVDHGGLLQRQDGAGACPAYGT